VPAETRLSAPGLETLAVIAYRQPVNRADIEAIRGVNCGEILRQLMDRDLVRIAGRGQELGRPYLYATTKRFLELFGLNQIDDLPRASELRAAPVPVVAPALVAAATEASREFCEPPIDEIASESTFG
jgi:segregation and condensation protein B